MSSFSLARNINLAVKTYSFDVSMAIMSGAMNIEVEVNIPTTLAIAKIT